MKLGAVYFFTDDGPDPVEFAQAAEGHGFESLFFPEHTHFPISRKSPYPAAYGGGELPRYYLRTHDQFVIMSMIAATTERLKLGTGVCLIAQHDPIAKAKQFATLDYLSGGRVICGVGFGWNRDEAEAHGVNWKKRFDIARDKVGVMRALWTQDEASYEGAEASLTPSWAWPKPKQRGGPPIYLGGAGPTTMRHAAQWADAWYVVPPPDDPTLERLIPQFWSIVDEVGRDRDSIKIAVASAPPDPAVLEAYIEHGVERAVLAINAGDSAKEGIKNLESVAKVLARMNGLWSYPRAGAAVEAGRTRKPTRRRPSAPAASLCGRVGRGEDRGSEQALVSEATVYWLFPGLVTLLGKSINRLWPVSGHVRK